MTQSSHQPGKDDREDVDAQVTQGPVARAGEFVQQNRMAIGSVVVVLAMAAGLVMFLRGDNTPPPRRVQEFVIVTIPPPPPPPPPRHLPR